MLLCHILRTALERVAKHTEPHAQALNWCKLLNLLYYGKRKQAMLVTNQLSVTLINIELRYTIGKK